MLSKRIGALPLLVVFWLVSTATISACSLFGDFSGSSFDSNNPPANFSSTRPKDFVSLADIAPDVIIQLRYITLHNFVGWPITGYYAEKCLLTKPAAQALAVATRKLLSLQPPFTLKVYDCYRPQMAVQEFVAWSSDNSTKMKAEFYPTLSKAELFPDGYIANLSSHSRGSTVDITLVPYPPPPEQTYVPGVTPLVSCFAPYGQRFNDNSIDMGTGFDCFNPYAHTDNTTEPIGYVQQHNRQFLLATMQEAGFKNLDTEWWHYTLVNEPYPNTYFNFPIE